MKRQPDKDIMSRSAVLYVTLPAVSLLGLEITVSVFCGGPLLSNAVVYCVSHSSHSCIFKLEVMSSPILRAETVPPHLSHP